MRIFALETNVDRIRRRYTVPDEEVLLLTRYHPVVFWLRVVYATLLIGLLSTVLMTAQGFAPLPPVLTYIVVWPIVVLLLRYMLQGFIRYRYNFILVTTEKVICINHTMIWKQEVNPTHIDNIISTKQKTQFMGILRCGVVTLNLRERADYSTKVIKLRYVPKHNKVAGAIENAIALYKQGKPISPDVVTTPNGQK